MAYEEQSILDVKDTKRQNTCSDKINVIDKKYSCIKSMGGCGS